MNCKDRKLIGGFHCALTDDEINKYYEYFYKHHSNLLAEWQTAIATRNSIPPEDFDAIRTAARDAVSIEHQLFQISQQWYEDEIRPNLATESNHTLTTEGTATFEETRSKSNHESDQHSDN